MKNRGVVVFILGVAALLTPLRSSAQTMPQLLPPQLEKVLSERAANVTEVTLGKNMLEFAAKFMDGKDKDQAAVRNLVLGLDGIYVRSYEFDKEGQYSMEEIEKIRQSFQGPEWSPLVHTRENKGAETTDVLMKQVNGEPRGMFVLTAEPKELTIVLIMGPIRMDQLSDLSGMSGLGSLGNVEKHKGDGQTKKGGNQ